MTLETTPLLLKIKHPNNQTSTDQSPNDETSLIACLESRLLSRFDNLSTEVFNFKDAIIQNLQIKNERLRNRVSYLNKRTVSLESNHNMARTIWDTKQHRNYRHS